METMKAIGITVGEPSGIGPDILLTLCAHSPSTRPILAVCSYELLQNRAHILGLSLQLKKVSEHALNIEPTPAGTLYVLDVPLTAKAPQSLHLGSPCIDTAPWVLKTIKVASMLCAKGTLAAMVTGPVQKSIINDAGIPFTGHTEYIAEVLSDMLEASFEPLMMLTTGSVLAHPLRVALATTHHPVADLPNLITEQLVLRKITALHDGIKTMYGIEKPRLLIAGFNPHAGENRHLGEEDEDAIRPAIHKAQARGIQASGPLPADTLFTPRHLRHADAVLAMYHDQGLPVLKYASFGGGINVTLNLPIIRTSVDHGTALDLAGTTKADHSSLQAAIEEAHLIVSQSRKVA